MNLIQVDLDKPSNYLWYCYGKGTSAPVARLLKEQRGQSPAMPPFSGVPMHIIIHALFTRCCRLQCVTVMNTNWFVSTLQVRGQKQNTALNAKTEQFITAKISPNALKQGSRTHSMLRQRSSQLQKYRAARMSRRIAVDQKVCGGDGGHPGMTIWNLKLHKN